MGRRLEHHRDRGLSAKPLFPSAANLASWASLCPGNNITGASAAQAQDAQGQCLARRDPYPECAWTAARSRGTYLSAQLWRLPRRIGKKKAAVAVDHSILVIACHRLTDDCDYGDLGGDYLAKRDTEWAKAAR